MVESARSSGPEAGTLESVVAEDHFRFSVPVGRQRVGVDPRVCPGCGVKPRPTDPTESETVMITTASGLPDQPNAALRCSPAFSSRADRHENMSSVVRPFTGRVSIQIFEDRLVLVPFEPINWGSTPLVVVPMYASSEVGRIAVVTARDLRTPGVREMRAAPGGREVSRSVTARLYGDDYTKRKRVFGVEVNVTFYNQYHNGARHMVVLLRSYQPPGSKEDQSVRRVLDWEGLTNEVLSEQIHALAAMTVEEMESEQV